MDFYTNFFLRGDKLYLRHVKNGARTKEKMNVSPKLYVPSNSEEPDCKSYDGVDLDSVQFNTPKEARDWAKENDLPGHPIYGFPRFDYTVIDGLYPGIDGVEFDFDALHVAIIDIETECADGFPNISRANEKINAISVALVQGDKYHIFALGLEPADVDDLEDATYKQCSNEYELLIEFVSLWKDFAPDIVSGWNSRGKGGFDIPYLTRRIAGVCGKSVVKELSPWGMVDYEGTQEFMGKEEPVSHIWGVADLDYLDLYKKFTYTMQESYKLDYIAHVELGEQKLDYSEDGGKLHLLYQRNYEKFIRYNIHDVRLVVRLEKKMKFIRLACTVAYAAKTNFQDVFMNVRLWDVIVNNYLNYHGKQGPFKTSKSADAGYAGAYVKEPIRGLHRWIASFDLTSLYPSLIMQNNISPETICSPVTFEDIGPENILAEDEKFRQASENAHNEGLALAGNGAKFRKDVRGVMPELMEKYFALRKDAKKRMFQHKTIVEQIDEILSEREKQES